MPWLTAISVVNAMVAGLGEREHVHVGPRLHVRPQRRDPGAHEAVDLVAQAELIGAAVACVVGRVEVVELREPTRRAAAVARASAGARAG